MITYKKIEEQLLKEYKVFYTELKILNDGKMKIVENKLAKLRFRNAISKAYTMGLGRANEIIKG